MTNPTGTTLLPFQPDAMTPAQLAAVSYLARYTGHTHVLYAAQLRRWFAWCESNALDPLTGIQRAHIELYIRHLHESGLRDSSVNTMMHVLVAVYGAVGGVFHGPIRYPFAAIGVFRLEPEKSSGGPRVWVGIDVGKGHHWASAVDETRGQVWSRRFVNDEALRHARPLRRTRRRPRRRRPGRVRPARPRTRRPAAHQGHAHLARPADCGPHGVATGLPTARTPGPGGPAAALARPEALPVAGPQSDRLRDDRVSLDLDEQRGVDELAHLDH